MCDLNLLWLTVIWIGLTFRTIVENPFSLYVAIAVHGGRVNFERGCQINE